MWFSHVRFLDRHVADQNQYIKIQYRDGRKEHRRGPLAIFFDPCSHVEMRVVDAYKLAANEALVVYREGTVDGGTSEDGKMTATSQQVERTVVRGPAVYIPGANEWVHEFSWHGSVNAAGKGSKTGTPGDAKVPHALQFEKIRCMPDQMYFTVRDVRTSDDAQIQIHLMVFYELVNIEKMLDASNDPIGDFINALSADVMSFGAKNTYETLLQRTSSFGDVSTFPTVQDRMRETGFTLLKVVYRGHSTSQQLQSMHDDAIAKRTKLRLQSDTAEVEQAEQAMQLRCRQERSHQEQELSLRQVDHEMSLLNRKTEQQRKAKDAEHEQHLRHMVEVAEAEVKAEVLKNDEQLRRFQALKDLGVDLTKVLTHVLPDQHIRIDSETPTAVHMEIPKGKARQ